MHTSSASVRKLLHAKLNAFLKEIFQQKLQERIAKQEQTQEAAPHATLLTVITSVEKHKRTTRKRKT